MLAVVFIVAGGVLLIVLLVVGGVVRYKRGSQGPMRRPKNSFKLRDPEDGSPQNSGKSGDPCSPAPKDRSKNPFKPCAEPSAPPSADNTGIALSIATSPTPPRVFVQALYDYNASRSAHDELSFKAGDSIEV